LRGSGWLGQEQLDVTARTASIGGAIYDSASRADFSP
jgi:hypothetical protein